MRAFLLLLLSLGPAWLQAAERTLIAPAWTARNTPAITVDSILLRDTLSRLYITLKQLPHTTLTLHDDWAIQDSTGRLIGKVKEVDGVDFDRIFQFEDDSIINIEMDFPALPPSLNEFDLTGNRTTGEMRIIGLSLTHRRELPPPLPHPQSAPSPPLPVVTFEPDSAWLQGRLIGYHRRLNLPDGKIALTDLFTGRQTTLPVPIADDGSFSVWIPLDRPMQQKLILGDRYLSFYIEPGDTLDIQVILDELFRPYRFTGEIEQNCTHLLYRGRNAQTNYDLKRIRLQSTSETKEWLKAMESLTPSQYLQYETEKSKVKLESLKQDWQAGALSNKSYPLSVLNLYYSLLSHLIVYIDITSKNMDCEYIGYKDINIPFADFSPLNEPLSTASEYYLPFISLLENREAAAAPPAWNSTEFIEALKARGITVSPHEKEALRFALGESDTPPENVRETIERLNRKSEKEQISMREEKLRERRKTLYCNSLGNPDDFTRQLLDARRTVKLMQSLQRALTPRELKEFSSAISDQSLRHAIEQINHRANK